MLTKFKSVVRELGWASGTLYAIDRAFGRVGGSIGLTPCVLVAQPVSKSKLLPEGRGKSIEVRQIQADDPALTSLPLTPELLKHRRDAGNVCFGAFKDNELIGCHWVALGAHNDEQFRVRLVPQPEVCSVWDFDIYLKPEQRSGFVFARLWEEVFEFLSKRGIDWSMSYISTFNPVSLASHRRLGVVEIGRALFVRLGAWQVILTTFYPFVSVSTGSNSRPTLYVPAPRK